MMSFAFSCSKFNRYRMCLRNAEDDLISIFVHPQELHSTRGVLAGERARAFQLQVETPTNAIVYSLTVFSGLSHGVPFYSRIH